MNISFRLFSDFGRACHIIIFLFIMLNCKEERAYKLEHDKLTIIIRDMNLVDLLTENKPFEIKDSLRLVNLNRLCSIHNTSISIIEHDLELISTDYLLLDSIYYDIIMMDTTSSLNSTEHD